MGFLSKWGIPQLMATSMDVWMRLDDFFGLIKKLGLTTGTNILMQIYKSGSRSPGIKSWDGLENGLTNWWQWANGELFYAWLWVTLILDKAILWQCVRTWSPADHRFRWDLVLKQLKIRKLEVWKSEQIYLRKKHANTHGKRLANKKT